MNAPGFPGTSPLDFKTLFESVPGLYLVLMPDLRIAAVSDSYLRATMTLREQIIGRHLFDVFPDNPADEGATGVSNLRASLQRVLANRVPDTMAIQKYDIRRPESEGAGFEERYWSPVNYPVIGEQGNVQYIIHRVEDVTEFVHLKQKRAEELKASEELRTMAGRMETELFQRAHELDAANQKLRAANEELERLAQLNEETRLILSGSEKRLRQLLEATPETILEVDAQGRILLANEIAESMFGYSREELLNLNVEMLVPAGLRSSHIQHRAAYTRNPRRRPMGMGLELKAQRKDGSQFSVEISLSPRPMDGAISTIVLVRDVSQRKQMEEALRRSEERLRQAQKLEALGRLAGGTAHEFNNLLTIIMGYAAMMLSAVDSKELLVNHVEKIGNAAKRAAVLTRQLLAFGRVQVLQPRVLDLNALVAENWDLLPSLIGGGIKPKFVPAPGEVWVKADPAQLQQVIVNLFTNARDAMPQGGDLTVEIAKVEFSAGSAREQPGLAAGKYASLAVSDTGIGMPPEVQARLFEPFFSTKGFGQGSGLSLAVVYGIVQQSSGSVSVRSSPGEGSTFTIFLPLLSAAEVVPDTTARPRRSLDSLRGTETILLVEDQPHLRALTRDFLEELGYTVLSAAHAEEAFSVAAAIQGQLDLLLTDIMLPGMNGREIAKRLKTSRPDLKVLYVSGYTQDVFAEAGTIDPDEAFLEKPFSPEELAHKIREVLGSTPKSHTVQ